MKKFVSIALSLVLASGMLAGCGQAASGASSSGEASSVPAGEPAVVSSSSAAEPESAAAADKTDFRIASLKGPTTMGLVELMQSADEGTARHNYQVTMYGAADEIAPQMIKGDIDIALVPCNLASVLYNKTEGKVQVAAVNTLGVLYILEKGESIQSVADLKGKTIYSTGKGTTPEYSLNHVLRQNGLEPGTDVTIEYKSEATEVLSALTSAGDGAVAMLPQPYATTAQMQAEGLNVALDLTKEWDKVSPDSSLVTGVVLVRREFAEQNQAALDEFLQDYQASVEWVNANTADAAQLVADYGIVPKAEVAQKALPACNIAFVAGQDMKAKVSGYLNVLFEADPSSVGGELPGDDFYYGA